MPHDKQSQELLMKEYQATQDMIRHYDDLTMRFGTMNMSGILIFVGLTFGLLTKDRQAFLYLFPFVILFVGLSKLLVHLWFKRHRSISQVKISRILVIERELGWRQFSLVDEAIKDGRIESKPVRNMLVAYYVALPLMLAIAYFIIFLFGF